MQQTFNDLYQERRNGRGWFGFMLWTFVETTLGIFREHLFQLTEGNIMKNIITNLRSPALISLILVVPFMVMELANRRIFNLGFPFPLFIIMWLLPVIFIFTATPIVQNLRAGNSLMVQPVYLLFRVVLLVFVTWMWFGIVIDQMPCFLGVPNCD